MKPDYKLKGLAYAEDMIRHLKKLFESFTIEMNNDVKNEMKLFDIASKGWEGCQLALDTLKHNPDEITIVIEKGDVSMVHGLPPTLEVVIYNVDTGETRDFSSESEVKQIPHLSSS